MSAQTKAFVASAGREFNGETLHAFTPQRAAVGAEMGMKWPWIDEDDEVNTTVPLKLSKEELMAIPKKDRPADGIRKITISHYRQSYKDSLIAIWLCLQIQSRVDRAERKPDDAMRDVWAWAKKVGVTAGGPMAGVALVTWIQMVNELANSKGEPIIPNNIEGEDDGSGEL